MLHTLQVLGKNNHTQNGSHTSLDRVATVGALWFTAAAAKCNDARDDS